MLLTQQVVHCLDGVERAERHLHKHGVPVAHGAIPQTRQLEGLQLLSALRLLRDETGGWVDILGQVEGLSLVVLDGADEVDRIEVGALGKHVHVLLVRLVNLAGFENLQADGAVLIVGEERTAARLTDIFHDAADAHRPVKFLAQVDDEVGILKVLDVRLAAAEVLLYEADNFLYLLVGVLARVEQAHIVEGFLLEGDEHAGYNLLPLYGVSLEAVGYDVVDVLDEDDVGINLVEVLNQCSVASGTEEQRTVAVAERCAVGVGGDGVRRGLLLGEGDVIAYAVLLGVKVGLLGYLLLEELHVLVAYGEVDVSLAVGGGVEGALHKVLLHGRARSLWVVVEEQQALWQLSVVESFGLEHVGGHSLVVTLGHESLDVLSLILLAGGIQLVVEGKLLDIVEIFLLKFGGGHVVVGIDESEDILEHTAGGTRGGHELDDATAGGFVLLPCVYILLAFCGSRCHDATADGCGGFELEEGESGLKLSQLGFDLLLRDSFLSQLLQVLL